QVAALSPAMLHARNGARRDARSAFEVLRRNAGQRYAPHLVACRFPGIPRHAQHRAFSRSGLADHDAHVAPVRDMRQGVGLLARENKTARFPTRKSRFAIRLTHLMAFPFRHEFGGAMQALFGLDHLAGGEAVFAASVPAECDQIWRATYRAHDLVKLVDPVAVPVRKLRHVAVCEGRLLLGDRVQCGGRIGDDPRTIAARDLAVHLGAVGGLDPFALDALRPRADLALRLQRDALCFQAAMVDARVDVEFGQALVGDLGPAFAPSLEHLRAVPVSYLLAKTVLVHSAHGEHDMGMWLWHAVLGHVPMHIEIGDHAPVHEFRLYKVAGKLNPLSLCHLAWNGELHLAGKLRVLADFESLDIVPQPLAVAPLFARILRQ